MGRKEERNGGNRIFSGGSLTADREGGTCKVSPEPLALRSVHPFVLCHGGAATLVSFCAFVWRVCHHLAFISLRMTVVGHGQQEAEALGAGDK